MCWIWVASIVQCSTEHFDYLDTSTIILQSTIYPANLEEWSLRRILQRPDLPGKFVRQLLLAV
jgi:hypothetical protein